MPDPFFDLPPGDPSSLRAAAHNLALISHDLTRHAGALQAEYSGMQRCWHSPSGAPAALAECGAAARVLGEYAGRTERSSTALSAYAEALATAQRSVGALQGQQVAATVRADRAASRAAAERRTAYRAAAEHAAVDARPASAAQLARMDPATVRASALSEATAPLTRAHSAVLGDLVAARSACITALRQQIAGYRSGMTIGQIAAAVGLSTRIALPMLDDNVETPLGTSAGRELARGLAQSRAPSKELLSRLRAGRSDPAFVAAIMRCLPDGGTFVQQLYGFTRNQLLNRDDRAEFFTSLGTILATASTRDGVPRFREFGQQIVGTVRSGEPLPYALVLDELVGTSQAPFDPTFLAGVGAAFRTIAASRPADLSGAEQYNSSTGALMDPNYLHQQGFLLALSRSPAAARELLDDSGFLTDLLREQAANSTDHGRALAAALTTAYDDNPTGLVADRITMTLAHFADSAPDNPLANDNVSRLAPILCAAIIAMPVSVTASAERFAQPPDPAGRDSPGDPPAEIEASEGAWAMRLERGPLTGLIEAASVDQTGYRRLVDGYVTYFRRGFAPQVEAAGTLEGLRQVISSNGTVMGHTLGLIANGRNRAAIAAGGQADRANESARRFYEFVGGATIGRLAGKIPVAPLVPLAGFLATRLVDAKIDGALPTDNQNRTTTVAIDGVDAASQATQREISYRAVNQKFYELWTRTMPPPSFDGEPITHFPKTILDAEGNFLREDQVAAADRPAWDAFNRPGKPLPERPGGQPHSPAELAAVLSPRQQLEACWASFDDAFARFAQHGVGANH